MTSMECLENHYKESFDVWVKRINRRVDCVMDAEDVVQEAYVKALRFLHTYDPERSSIQTWFTLLINQTFAKMRSVEFNSCEIQEDDIFTPNADEVEGDVDLFNRIMKRITEQENSDHRQILWLYFGCSVPVRDIGKFVEVEYHNARTIIARFKKAMREKYERGEG